MSTSASAFSSMSSKPYDLIAAHLFTVLVEDIHEEIDRIMSIRVAKTTIQCEEHQLS
jgi:hypothetical protein